MPSDTATGREREPILSESGCQAYDAPTLPATVLLDDISQTITDVALTIWYDGAARFEVPGPMHPWYVYRITPYPDSHHA